MVDSKSTLVARAMKVFSAGELDHYVKDCKAAEAEEINRGGLKRQLEYLCATEGEEWLQGVLEELGGSLEVSPKPGEE